MNIVFFRPYQLCFNVFNQLIDSETEQVAAKGLCERIGINGSRLVYSPMCGHKSGEKQTIIYKKKKFVCKKFMNCDDNFSSLMYNIYLEYILII